MLSAPGKSGRQKFNVALTLTVLSLFVGLVLALAVRSAHPHPTRSEVSRVDSPDGSVWAVVYESPADAKSAFRYEVEITSGGKSQLVASLAGAMRNDRAYGVDLHWIGPSQLSVDYLHAQSASVVAGGHADLGGHSVLVTPHSGVRDESAPAGGMLFNLQHAHDAGF
jgi:hypothetical protein